MEVGDAFRADVAAELALVPLGLFGADFVAFEAQALPLWLRLEVICEGVPSRLLVAATLFSSFILDSLQHAAAAMPPEADGHSARGPIEEEEWPTVVRSSQRLSSRAERRRVRRLLTAL